MTETRRLVLILLGSLVAGSALILTAAKVAHIDLATVIMVLFIAAACIVNPYLLVYSTRRWWESPPGRALWVKALGNAILVDLSLAGVLTGRAYPFREEALTVGMTVFVAGNAYLLFTVSRAPRRVRVVPEQRQASLTDRDGPWRRADPE